MDPRSEVLLRNAELFEAPLLAGLPADGLLAELHRALGWSWHAGEHQVLAARFADRCHFGTQPPASRFEQAVLFLPKSRELGEYLVQRLAAQLAGGMLYVVGEKRGGIERAGKFLANLGAARKLDSARHCQLWQVAIDSPPAMPDLQAQAKRYRLDDLDVEVHSLPGVFAHGRLDTGSALLLECLADLADGPLLDYGCGAGVLAAALGKQYPGRPLYLLDVDAFALESSRLTLAANGLEGTVLAADSLAAAPASLAALISNPPFHQGVHTDYAASEALLRDAARHLRPGGELRIVANAFLNYPTLIERHFGHCQVLAARDGFRVYKAVRGA